MAVILGWICSAAAVLFFAAWESEEGALAGAVEDAGAGAACAIPATGEPSTSTPSTVPARATLSRFIVESPSSFIAFEFFILF
jgi:hypothetical protein